MAAETPADAVPVETVPADTDRPAAETATADVDANLPAAEISTWDAAVESRHLPAPEDRTADVSQADACLLNLPARHRLLPDLRARLLTTAAVSFSVKRTGAVLFYAPVLFLFTQKYRRSGAPSITG